MNDNFIKETMLAEFDNEMATTRKILALVPFDKFDWVPHAKSSPLGRLAVHVASLPGMGVDILTKDSLGFDGKYNPPQVKSTEDIMKIFEEKSSATRAAIVTSTDEDFMKQWSLVFQERPIFQGSRLTAFQGIMMNHLIHHRAQLGVYLRLNDIAIPGSYGPSADQPM